MYLMQYDIIVGLDYLEQSYVTLPKINDGCRIHMSSDSNNAINMLDFSSFVEECGAKKLR